LPDADADAAASGGLAGRVNVLDEKLKRLDRSRLAERQAFAITTEQAEPGGVICATRVRSVGRMSWSDLLVVKRTHCVDVRNRARAMTALG
jgi:hypothetical protein